MAICIKEILMKNNNFMAKEFLIGPMVINTRENMLKTIKKVKEFLPIKMEQNIKDFLKREKFMEKV